MIFLQELELESYVDENKSMLENEPDKTIWKSHNNKVMKIIIDAVKDHILPTISKLKTTYDMFMTIQNTYEINNTSRLLTLKQQLFHIKMNKWETITSYLMRISELKDWLSTIGNNVDDKELSLIALKGLPISWESFIQGISARPELPKCDQFKNDCTQEESSVEV